MFHGCSYAVMTERDIGQVLEIERAVFKHPWTGDFFRLIIADYKNYVITLRRRGEIIGYGGYHLLKNRTSFLATTRDYQRIIHLINLAVRPDQQRRGFGTFLLETLLRDAAVKRAEYCYLEVRPSNAAAFSFYKALGFAVIGLIDNYYPLEGEDALVLGRELGRIRIQD